MAGGADPAEAVLPRQVMVVVDEGEAEVSRWSTRTAVILTRNMECEKSNAYVLGWSCDMRERRCLRGKHIYNQRE